MSTTIGLAIPQPSQLVDVVNLCQSIEAQLPFVEDMGQLKDAEFKLRAIDEYLALTSTEGRQAVAATIYRIQMRAGEVLGEASPNGKGLGSSAIDPSELTKDERYHLRLMAAHSDIVEQEIAKGTDERPTSRRQVLGAIRESMRAEEQRFRDDLASKGVQVLTDPKEIAANKAWIEMDAAVAGAIRQVLEVAARYSNDDLERLTTDSLWKSTAEKASRASAFLKYLSTLGAEQ
jgi:DNA-binding transcriptional MerR regulator